jgi:transposase
MKLNISFIEILKKIILGDTEIGIFYRNQYPNSKYSLDDILNELLYFLKSGVSWKNLRSKINTNTLYWHFRRFVSRNIFNSFFIFLRNEYFKHHNCLLQIIDSTCIFNKLGKEMVARNKFYKNKNCNKVSLVTDSFGIPLSAIIKSGNVHDLNFLSNHIDDLLMSTSKNSYFTLLSDKGYVSAKHKSFMKYHNYNLIYPHKKNMQPSLNFNKIQYKKRINIEHTFSKLKAFKRIQLRYDSTISSFSQFIFLALSIILFRSL